MIKATMVCTNCKKEKEIPYDVLEEAVKLDKAGELNLCVACMELWSNAVEILRQDRAMRFAKLQNRFGIGK